VYILRPFQKKVIQRRPSQDVREEFRRLDMLTHQTIMQHGAPDEASEARRYLVDTFSSQALPNPDSEITVHDDARRLEALQKTNSRLIAGDSMQSEHTTSSFPHRRARITKRAALDSDTGSSGQKRPRTMDNTVFTVNALRPQRRERIQRR
jgi:hypothetical protein